MAGGVRDGGFAGLNAAEHFVLDLDQVVRIEEAGGLEPGVRDGIGFGMESALATKKGDFCGVLLTRHTCYQE